LQELINKALNGNVRSIARIISIVENESQFTEEIMKTMYPHSGNAHIIGVTGSPGAGKSTLVDKLIESSKADGKNVGVIAVDPTSPFSGGAILADRIRMQRHAVDPAVYIRSMGTRGSLGGLSRSTYEAALILDACGKDVVFIETVGVGQSEVDIMKIADTVCLALVPGMGDDIQIMKAGIMEIADILVINKSDRDGSEKIVAEVQTMLDLLKGKNWVPPVLKTVAEKGTGVKELSNKILCHKEFLQTDPEGRNRKLRQLTVEIEAILQRELAKLTEHQWGQHKDEQLMEKLLNRETDPYTVAGKILEDTLLNTPTRD